MKNSEFDSHDVKRICENKLGIEFGGKKEFNGWYLLDGKKKARITIPKGKKFLPFGTYGSMAKQLLLSTPQFDELLVCTFSAADYLKEVSKK